MYKNFYVFLIEWDETHLNYNGELPGEAHFSVAEQNLKLDKFGMLESGDDREKIKNLLEENYNCRVSFYMGEGCNCEDCNDAMMVVKEW